MKYSLLLILVLLIGVTACSPKSSAGMAAAKPQMTKASSSPYLGDWKYIVPGTPMGDVSGKLVLKIENDVLKGYIDSDGSISLIEDIKLENNKLTGNIYYSGTLVKLDGLFDGDKFQGDLLADGANFKITAARLPK